MFTVDTNILVYYAAGDKTVKEFFERHEDEVFYVPSIAVVEFLSYPLITTEAINALHNFLSQMLLLNLDFIIAERAAEVKRDDKLKLADDVVAASTLTTRSALLTRNRKDFEKVKNLSIIAL